MITLEQNNKAAYWLGYGYYCYKCACYRTMQAQLKELKLKYDNPLKDCDHHSYTDMLKSENCISALQNISHSGKYSIEIDANNLMWSLRINHIPSNSLATIKSHEKFEVMVILALADLYDYDKEQVNNESKTTTNET